MAKLVLIAILIGILSTPILLHSELMHGFAQSSFISWDFSDSCTAGLYEADITIIHVKDMHGWPRDLIIAYEGAAITQVTDSSFSELAIAPADSSVYTNELDIYLNYPYVVRTAEGCYAKLKIIDSVMGYFEYVYQTDGSRILSEKVPIEATTWGRVKLLFDHTR